MTEENAYAPPRANLETQAGPQELWSMELKKLRRLYDASRSIRALGFLYALGTVGLFAGYEMLNSRYARSADTRGIAVVMLFVGGLSLLGFVTSFTRQRWGRWVGVLICLLNLVNIPFGTLIGLFGLVAYARGGRLFGPDRLLHKDVVDVYKQRKAAKT